jgi:hypothetical protein
MHGCELYNIAKKFVFSQPGQSSVFFMKFKTFHVTVKRLFFGNEPICASTVLECSCCRIHRYVAAPRQRQTCTLTYIISSCCRFHFLTFIFLDSAHWSLFHFPVGFIILRVINLRKNYFALTNYLHQFKLFSQFFQCLVYSV